MNDNIFPILDGINNVSQESVAGITQISHATDDLNQLTVSLQNLISRFKTGLENNKPSSDKLLNNDSNLKLVRY